MAASVVVSLCGSPAGGRTRGGWQRAQVAMADVRKSDGRKGAKIWDDCHCRQPGCCTRLQRRPQEAAGEMRPAVATTCASGSCRIQTRCACNARCRAACGGCALPVQSSRAHRRHSGSWSAGPTTLHQNFSVHPAALNASVMPSPPHGSRMLPGYSPEPVRHQIALPISVRRNPAHQLRPWGWQHPNHLDHAQLGYST